MIKRIYISLQLAFVIFVANGQEIIIQPPIFSEFECTEFYKLYTGSVTNFSQETFETSLLLEVDYTNPSGNRIRLADGVLKGNPSTDFAPGLTLINNATYESIYSDRQITFYDTELQSLIATTKCLPPGTYEVCLTLYDINNADGPTNFLTQTCYVREKQMFSQLLLVSPFEDSEIIMDMPLFTWTPVTPIIPQANYTIQMVEILGDQTPYEAFRANPVFFEQTGLMSNIFQYPVAARTMLPCTRYAWRVMYSLNGSFVSQAFLREPDFLQTSELWTFHTPCEEEEEEKPFEPLVKQYIKPSLLCSSQFHIQRSNKLRFEIDNSYEELNELSFNIIDEAGSIQAHRCCGGGTDDTEDDIPTKPGIQVGKNYITLDLDDLNLVRGENYKIVFKDFKTDLFINFKYEEDEN